eukprot:TRINITY_DN10080_c0_g1_i14.p1 TRINITY_DN10080_c0_g1~~TRINITY_DN10080_c0_g1_i14.p1  ORF type:complete len:309 (+),score=21.91 TRINITY_DN10080_c0_g1_i14:68-928(+)
MVETRKQFISNITVVKLLPLLLIIAKCIDCDLEVSRILVDNWLLIKIIDHRGPQFLKKLCKIRAKSSLYLNQQLDILRSTFFSDRDAYSSLRSNSNFPPICIEIIEILQECRATQQEYIQDQGQEQFQDQGQMLAMNIVKFLSCEDEFRYDVELLQQGSQTTAQFNQNQSLNQCSQLDSVGVPLNKVGYKLAPWLWIGSLKTSVGEMDVHLLQSAVRRHWTCIQCGAKMVETAQGIQEHASICFRSEESLRDKIEAGYVDKRVFQIKEKEDTKVQEGNSKIRYKQN